MNVSRRVDYAMRALSYIAGQSPARAVPRAEIEARQSVPLHFLAKVLRRLVVGGILRSTPGVGGGFRLARPATELSFCDVYECVEGRIRLIACVDDGERFCEFAPVCTQIDVWRSAQDHLRRHLGSISLAAIADQHGLVSKLTSQNQPPPAGY